MIELARRLCQGLTGSRCAAPRESKWTLVEPSQAGIGVDAVDVGTLGVGSVIPINTKIYGGTFTTGLICDASEGGMCAALKGWGGGGGASFGLNTPGIATRFVGNSKGLKKEILKRAAAVIDGQIMKGITDAAWTGESGGTRLIAGPDAPAALSLVDFDQAFASICSLAGNFGPNGVSAGIVIFSKKQPVIEYRDMVYCTAIGLMAGLGLATSIDFEANGQVYVCSLN